MIVSGACRAVFFFHSVRPLLEVERANEKALWCVLVVDSCKYQPPLDGFPVPDAVPCSVLRYPRVMRSRYRQSFENLPQVIFCRSAVKECVTLHIIVLGGVEPPNSAEVTLSCDSVCFLIALVASVPSDPPHLDLRSPLHIGIMNCRTPCCIWRPQPLSHCAVRPSLNQCTKLRYYGGVIHVDGRGFVSRADQDYCQQAR
ncbi:hypothetical protein EDD21DRAFT_6831 [Dissophora ornata]|nr:hypothetical protein EDD21DRAFT_6831 [Dissophora ornata]